jgi:hypothetical protein
MYPQILWELVADPLGSRGTHWEPLLYIADSFTPRSLRNFAMLFDTKQA